MITETQALADVHDYGPLFGYRPWDEAVETIARLRAEKARAEASAQELVTLYNELILQHNALQKRAGFLSSQVDQLTRNLNKALEALEGANHG